MKAAHRYGAVWSMALLAAAALSGCVDEKIVYREGPMFTEPPAAAASYVGYSKSDQKQTTCGNCHVDFQTKWAQTDHAGAWESLEASGHMTDACIGCHSVSSKGNADTASAVGYASTKDSRYYDVQCENCHGKGLAHVSNPKTDNRPLASIAVYNFTTDEKSGCGECHTGEHEPYVDEWKDSGHGKGTELFGHANGSSCLPCHSAQGALGPGNFNITNNYKEKDGTLANGGLLSITCAVCHDPHSKNNEKQLRFPIDVADETNNLCMKCHHKRGTPDFATYRGAHSPEGPVLLGYGGWFPPGMTDTLVATHGSEANPRLCAGCHVNRFTVNDASGNFMLQATGHRFNAIPCLNADGTPKAGEGAEECSLSERDFRACTASGCHGSQAVARSALITAQTRMEELAGELHSMLLQVPLTEFNSADNKNAGGYTVAEGALFNVSLVLRLVGDSAKDLRLSGVVMEGNAIHNPFLLEMLYIKSIEAVRNTYGIAPSRNVALKSTLRLD